MISFEIEPAMRRNGGFTLRMSPLLSVHPGAIRNPYGFGRAQSGLCKAVWKGWKDRSLPQSQMDYPHLVTLGRTFGVLPRIVFVGHEAMLSTTWKEYGSLINHDPGDARWKLAEWWQHHLEVERADYYATVPSQLSHSQWWSGVYSIFRGAISGQLSSDAPRKGRAWDAHSVFYSLGWANLLPCSYIEGTGPAWSVENKQVRKKKIIERQNRIRKLNIEKGLHLFTLKQVRSIEPDVTVITVNSQFDDDISQFYGEEVTRRDGIAVLRESRVVVTSHLERRPVPYRDIAAAARRVLKR